MPNLQPLLDIALGSARYIDEPPPFESGHNFSNEIGNLDVRDDWQAILAFLNEYCDSPQTFRTYAGEIERLCLWLIHVRSIPLSGVKRQDLLEFYQFLAEPPNHWCGAATTKFLPDGSVNGAWRPFKRDASGAAGLAPSSIQRSKRVIRSLFGYLVNEGYLLGNPATARRTKGQREAKATAGGERFLQPHEAMFVEQVLRAAVARAEALGDGASHFKALRRFYTFELFLHTGLRISEPVDFRMGDIKVRGTGDSKILYLEIRGKGNIMGEHRTVVLGKAFVEILKEYRLSLNRAMAQRPWIELDPLPAFDEPTPLIPDASGTRPVGTRLLTELFREIRDICVAALDALLISERDPDRSEDLKRMRSTLGQFTCHWMRHTHATYFLALTRDLRATQDRLGHADLSTTQIYAHVLDKVRDDTANQFDPNQMLGLTP